MSNSTVGQILGASTSIGLLPFTSSSHGLDIFVIAQITAAIVLASMLVSKAIAFGITKYYKAS